MTSSQPESKRPPIHPEILAGIPEEWRVALIEFINTGQTSVEGFDDFLNSSEAAQNAIDSAFQGRLRQAGQKHIDRIDRTGGRFQAAESLAEQSGLSLDQAMKLEAFLNDSAERIIEEENELKDK